MKDKSCRAFGGVVVSICLWLVLGTLTRAADDEYFSSSSRAVLDLLVKQKALQTKSVRYVIEEREWSLDAVRLASVRRIANSNAFEHTVNNEMSEAVGQGRQMVDLVSKAAGEAGGLYLQWTLTFLNGMTKFEEKYMGVQEPPPGLDKDNKTQVLTSDGNQYLYTDSTKYLYRPSGKYLTVKPLDQLTDTYPLRLDYVNFMFNIKDVIVNSAEGFAIQKFDGGFSLIHKEASAIISFRVKNGKLFPCYFFVEGDKNNFVEKTFGSFFMVPGSVELCAPASCLTVTQLPDGTGKATAMTMQDASSGKVDEANFPIVVPKGTGISDQTATVPTVIRGE